MKRSNSYTPFILGALSAIALCAKAGAVIYVVPGTSDPWLAGQPDGTTASGTDVAPDQSPVDAGSYTAGSTIFWTAKGDVINFGGGGGPGPDGDPGWLTFHDAGAENGIADVPAPTPLNSLIGVWFGGGVGTPFFMGSSGSAVVPAGTTHLYLGSMDGFEWSNNSGSFEVDLNVRGVPEGGSTLALFGIVIGLMGASAHKFRRLSA